MSAVVKPDALDAEEMVDDFDVCFKNSEAVTMA